MPRTALRATFTLAAIGTLATLPLAAHAATAPTSAEEVSTAPW